jgi:nitroimidazol reductase NimA-like FMN-containing flavoprotein (pyridoxamine 5'-phosphate oxidase superfamily)
LLASSPVSLFLRPVPLTARTPVFGSTLGPMALSAQERQEFLAEPHIGALSVELGGDSGPLVVPIWYQYAPGEQLWIHTGAESRKTRAIRKAGRFSLMAQRVEPTVRYVSVEGAVTGIDPATPDLAREMAARYLPAEKVEHFLRVMEEAGEDVVISMRPERWWSADLGAL